MMSGKIIDCQVHCAAPAIEDLLPYMKQGWADRFVRTAFQLPGGQSHPGGGSIAAVACPADISARLGDDVSVAVLLPHQGLSTANWTDTRLCAVYASALNSYMVDHWLGQDDRFRLAIAVSPHEPELAAAEIEKHARDERVVAISMPMLAPHLGTPFYRPIIEAAARNDLTLIIHPGGKEGTIVGTPALAGIGPRFHGEYECLICQVAAVNIASAVYDGLFVEFPNLRLAFADFGFDWVGPAMWRMDAEWRAMRIDVPWVAQAPSKYIAQNVRIIVSETDALPEGALAEITAMIPPSSILFGSNTPFDSDLSWVDALPEALREQVCHGNAVESFRRLEAIAA